MNLLRVACGVAFVLVCATGVDAATATWDRNPEPDIAGYLLSYGPSPGIHTTTIDVGNVTSYQFFPPPGRYYVVVQAYNRSSGVSLKSNEAVLNVAGGTNRAPTLTQPANRTSAENSTASLQLVGSDPDGTAVTYSATGLPQGLAINASSGLISGTLSYTSAGTHTVTARVSDGALTASRTFTWTVTNTNRAPTLTQPSNRTTARGSTVSLQLVASDPDGNPLTYSAIGLPTGLTVNSSTGRISGTATTAGTFNSAVRASDGSLYITRNFTWTVSASTGSTTISLSPQDTYINISTTNFSGAVELNTYTYPANRVANAILMKFNLSQIPANATIQSAILSLSLTRADSNTSDPTYNISLHQIINRNPDLTRATGRIANATQQWTANTCCYNSYPVAQADIGPARATNAVNRTLGRKTWDATTIVRAWKAAPSTNFGLLLNADATKGAHRNRYFASRENANASLRPFLRVTYTVPGGTGTTTATAMSVPDDDATASGASVTASATASDPGAAAGVQPFTPTTSDGAVTASPTSTGVNNSDLAISGDFDGDGRPDLGTYRPSTGEWRIWTSRTKFASAAPITWGAENDVPVPADYDADGRTDVAVYRPSTGGWHVLLSTTNYQTTLDVVWGDDSDRPMPMDYDRDGRADLALARGDGYDILLSSTNYSSSVKVR